MSTGTLITWLLVIWLGALVVFVIGTHLRDVLRCRAGRHSYAWESGRWRCRRCGRARPDEPAP